MPSRYPSLSYTESANILKALGFIVKAQKGSHEHWEGIIAGIRRKVTLKINIDYDERDIRSHIKQAGVSREQYYGATERTAKKVR